MIQIQESQIQRSQIELSFSRLEENTQKDRMFSVINWLSAVDVSCDLDAALAVRIEDAGSGSWILQNEKIKKWADPPDSLIPLLWLHGIPGAGMSSWMPQRSRDQAYNARKNCSCLPNRRSLHEDNFGPSSIFLL